jgi:hypothetical protein
MREFMPPWRCPLLGPAPRRSWERSAWPAPTRGGSSRSAAPTAGRPVVHGLRLPGTGRRAAIGVSRASTARTQECFPNDLGTLRRKLLLNRLRGGTAAVLLEPIGPESGTRPVHVDYNRKVRVSTY